jgi:hypothetical protein
MNNQASFASNPVSVRFVTLFPDPQLSEIGLTVSPESGTKPTDPSDQNESG